MKFLKLHFWIIVLVPFLTFGQSAKPIRVEIEPKSKSDDYYIVPAGKDGILVFNETNEKSEKKKERMWNFSLYDVGFKEKWTKSSSVAKGLDFVKFYIEDKNLYILLAKGSSGNGTLSQYSGDFTILKLDMLTDKITSANNKLPYNTTINDFKVYNGLAYFGGKQMPTGGQKMAKQCMLYCTCCIPLLFGAGEFKTNATLITTDNNGKTMFPSVIYKGNSNLNSIDIDTESKQVNCFISNRPDKKTANAFIHEYDQNGKSINTIKMIPGDNEILTGNINTLKGGSKYVMGTFSLPVEKSSFGVRLARGMAPTSGSYAQGMYIAKVDKGKQEFIKYYSFTDFKNFFSYLGNKGETRVEKRAKKKKEKGQDLKLNYNILVHQLIEKDDKLVLVGECYYPEYHTEYYTDYVNGKPVTRTRRVFDGYRYTHAVVANFDKQGKLLWDATFPIMDILTFNLKERVKVLVQDNKMVLVYSYGGSLISKVLANNVLSDSKDATPIDTGSDADNVKSNISSDVIYWYDNYFVAWGYQKIKNKEEESGKKKRFVFYFNKVAFK